MKDFLPGPKRKIKARPLATAGQTTVLTIALVVLSGCGVGRGEMVESNFANTDVVELAFTEAVDAEQVEDPLRDYEVVEILPDEPAPGIFAFDARDAFT